MASPWHAQGKNSPAVISIISLEKLGQQITNRLIPESCYHQEIDSLNNCKKKWSLQLELILHLSVSNNRQHLIEFELDHPLLQTYSNKRIERL